VGDTLGGVSAGVVGGTPIPVARRGAGAADFSPWESHPGSVWVSAAIASMTSEVGTWPPASQRDTAAAVNALSRPI
jgi:hypothetical protein